MEIESDSFIMFCIRPTDFGNKLVADISHRKYYPRDNTLGRKLPRGLPMCNIIRSRYGEYSNMATYLYHYMLISANDKCCQLRCCIMMFCSRPSLCLLGLVYVEFH